MSFETIRLSKQARDQLVTLKRRTGVQHWNTLCRWAFCISVAEASPPRRVRIPSDSNVEMSWRTFAGEWSGIFLALLRREAADVGLPQTDDILGEQCRLHIHRGIGYLVGDPSLRDIAGLVKLAVEKWRENGESSDGGDRAASDGNRAHGVVKARSPRRRVAAD